MYIHASTGALSAECHVRHGCRAHSSQHPVRDERRAALRVAEGIPYAQDESARVTAHWGNVDRQQALYTIRVSIGGCSKVASRWRHETWSMIPTNAHSHRTPISHFHPSVLVVLLRPLTGCECVALDFPHFHLHRYCPIQSPPLFLSSPEVHIASSMRSGTAWCSEPMGLAGIPLHLGFYATFPESLPKHR